MSLRVVSFSQECCYFPPFVFSAPHAAAARTRLSKGRGPG